MRGTNGRPPTPYERRKRRGLAATAGQAWVFFAAWESVPYVAVVSVVLLIGHALGIT